MRNFRIKIVLIILVITTAVSSCYNSDQNGYFSRMPRTYRIDSLTVYKDLFGSLTTDAFRMNGVSALAVNCNNCMLIPFCGVLVFKNDTIYYVTKNKETLTPYLVTNGNRFSSLDVEYSVDRADRVTYMGKMYDKHNHDSIDFFQLKPLRRKAAIDASYLKYIAIKEGGIRYFTFSNSVSEITVRLTSYPKVIWANQSY